MAYYQFCFVFPVHNLRKLQCADPITPADQSSNPICGFQGSLHVFAGHSLALLGISIPHVTDYSGLSYNISSLPNMLECPFHTKPHNCPQCRRLVNPCHSSWHCVCRREDHVQYRRSLLGSSGLGCESCDNSSYY